MKIEIKHLKKSFDDNTVLKNFSLTIEQGEVVSLIGPSGTGKSTLIRCINKMIVPDGGDIVIDSESILSKEYNIYELRRRIGMVFQSYNLFSHLTVIENIVIPQVDILKRSKSESYKIAMDLLKRVGLLEKYLAYPDDLSGGQKQRVAIARALALNPDVIMLDEPTSALDPTTVGEVESVILKLAKSGKTIILITHQLELAKKISSRVIFMSNGMVLEEGTPEEIFDNPKQELTKRFVRSLKCLDLNISTKTYDFIESINKIKVFCNNSNIPSQVTYNLMLAFEEIVHNHLIDELDTDLKILYSLTFDDKTNEISLDIFYNGKEFNPFALNDESMNLIKKIFVSTYEIPRGNEYSNRLSLRLKSK